MPEISLRHVVSCSSQDSTHCAENLLKADTYRKWRAATAGEKTISVVLQLEKEEQIHSIDIGNDGSAFVEVLVTRSAGGGGATAIEQDYEVLLVTSSFMSPSESRSGSNPNRVRMFGPDKLVRAAAEKRWDRVKIVCSQPYSKDSPYGLSFVRFHSPPDKDEAETPSQKGTVTKLGQFRVKEEDDGASSLKPGALFFSRINKTSSVSARGPAGPSYAAATLQASNATSSASSVSKALGSSCKPQESPKGKRKLDLNLEDRRPASKPSAGPPTLKRPKLTVPSRSPAAAAASTPAQKAAPGKPREARFWASEAGLCGKSGCWTVTACGAGCPPAGTSWQGLAPAVRMRRTTLPVSVVKTKLPSFPGSGLRPKPRPKQQDPAHPRDHPLQKRPNRPHQNPRTIVTLRGNSQTSQKTSLLTALLLAEGQDNGAEDSGDTEDELRRVAEQREQRQPPAPGENGEDPYAGSTDENTDNEASTEADLPIPELPDFFQGKHFFLYGEFPGDERRKLIRYVTAFNGELEDYMSERVQFVITAQEWDPIFEEALMENPSLAFVRPRWIYSCNEKQKLLPHQLYGVVPQA